MIEFDEDVLIQAAEQVRDDLEYKEFVDRFRSMTLKEMIKESANNLDYLRKNNIRPTLQEEITLRFCLLQLANPSSTEEDKIIAFMEADRIIRRIKRRST